MAGTPHTFHCPHPRHGWPLPTSSGIGLSVGDLSSGYEGSSGRDSPREVCAPPPEAICCGDDGSEVAEWPAGTLSLVCLFFFSHSQTGNRASSGKISPL